MKTKKRTLKGENMPGGNNHAKQTVLKMVKDIENDSKKIVDDLQNGKSGDSHTISKAIALLIKSDSLTKQMITPLFEAEFVTIEDCKAAQKECRLIQEGMKLIKKEGKEGEEGEITELSIGPMHIKGKLDAMIVGMIILAVGVGFVIGKTEGWW